MRMALPSLEQGRALDVVSAAAPADNLPDLDIRVVGVGGGGCNAVNTMVCAGIGKARFIAVNTDRQALESSRAEKRLLVGARVARGLGASARPEAGRTAAGIADLLALPGYIGLDCGDLRAVTRKMGSARVGVGIARSEEGAMEAAWRAIESPLLGRKTLESAGGVILSFKAGPGVSLQDVLGAVERLKKALRDDAALLYGFAPTKKLAGIVRVMVVAG